MNPKSFENLQVGDTVKSKSSGITYVITAHFGDRITVVRTADLTNPYEWEVIKSARANENN